MVSLAAGSSVALEFMGLSVGFGHWVAQRKKKNNSKNTVVLVACCS